MAIKLQLLNKPTDDNDDDPLDRNDNNRIAASQISCWFDWWGKSRSHNSVAEALEICMAYLMRINWIIKVGEPSGSSTVLSNRVKAKFSFLTASAAPFNGEEEEGVKRIKWKSRSLKLYFVWNKWRSFALYLKWISSPQGCNEKHHPLPLPVPLSLFLSLSINHIMRNKILLENCPPSSRSLHFTEQTMSSFFRRCGCCCEGGAIRATTHPRRSAVPAVHRWLTFSSVCRRRQIPPKFADVNLELGNIILLGIVLPKRRGFCSLYTTSSSNHHLVWQIWPWMCVLQ